MYTLYYLPDACSLATQVILHELAQPVAIVDKRNVEQFSRLNPTGAVPVLVDGDKVLRECAAIMLYLLDKHTSALLPAQGQSRQRAIENILFANATMHPAYSRLFFIAQHMADGAPKAQAFAAARDAINQLWQVVDERLAAQPFLGGEQLSAADVMLAVYSRWGENFPVTIEFGHNSRRMIAAVFQRASFQRALANEQAQAAAA